MIQPLPAVCPVHAKRRWLLLIPAVLLVMAGCDFGADGDETVQLQEEFLFRFSFSSDTVQTGQVITLLSAESVDLDARLRARGFEVADLRSVRVSEGVIEILFPLDETVSFLQEVGLGFRTDEAQTGELAGQQEFPDGPRDDTVNLDILSNEDLTSFLQAATFRAYMRLEAQSLMPDETYDIAAELTLNLGVALSDP